MGSAHRVERPFGEEPFAELLAIGPPATRPPALARPRWLLAGALFLATLFSTTTLGAVWYLVTRTDRFTDLGIWLTPTVVSRVWSDPELLAWGLRFSLPLMFILLCHELGHYLTCRRYGLSATLPYFLPLPLGLGTFGAFIRIRSPIRNKRELFDIGVSGPLAGFVALLPFLWIGVALSQVEGVEAVPESEATGWLLLPGRSLALVLAARWTHGPMTAGTELIPHPFALAAWVGLLVTALNLIPVGQLDGGHVLYAVAGVWQRRLARFLWVGLMVMGWLFWPGFWIFGLLVLIMGLRHPRVIDERRPLDHRRMALAVLAGLLLVLSFTPDPLRIIPVS